jgi:hypothetical protein
MVKKAETEICVGHRLDCGAKGKRYRQWLKQGRAAGGKEDIERQ